MRVVYVPHVPHSMTRGGSEVQLRKTRQAIERLGVTVDGLDLLSETQLREVDLVHLFGSDPLSLGTLADYLSGEGIPHVISSIYYPTGAERRRDYARAWIGKTPVRVQRKMLRRADRVLPNSNAEQQLLEQMFRLKSRSISVIPNGVEANPPSPDPDDFRKRFLPDLPKNERFILSVGRIEKRKNSISLLKAAQSIGAPIVFVGPFNGIQSGYEAQFKEVAQSGKSFVQQIPGFPYDSPDLWSAFGACHVHALVSILETPGLVNLEAGLMGANLVYGRCPAVDEYIGSCARSVPQFDITQIGKTLSEELSANRGHKNPEQHIRANFTWDVVAKKTKAVYDEVLNAKS